MHAIEHAKFSHLVRDFAQSRTFREAASWADVSIDEAAPAYRLQCPDNPFHSVWVSFRRVAGRPGLMRIHSGNWRCEDEVNGVYTIQDARLFYRALAAAGFIAF